MWVVQAEEAGMGDGGMAGMAQRQAWRRGLGMAQAGGLTGGPGHVGRTRRHLRWRRRSMAL